MAVEHRPEALQSPAWQQLEAFLAARHQAWQAGPPDFEQFEHELHAPMMRLERECVAEELSRYDVQAEQIELEGIAYRPVLRTATTYLSAAGPVRVERQLYRPAGRPAKSICPLELRAGIIQGYWTPRAARQGADVMAQVPAAAAAALLGELGAMQPSRSTLARLPRELSAPWEAHRPDWEATLQRQEPVPPGATTMAVSVDGVLAPLKPQGAPRSATPAAPGKHASGPTGYREVGCGTVSLYDAEGARLQTVRYARMPEAHKGPLAQQLQTEAQALLAVRPDIQRGYLAEGAESNWTLLAELDRALGEPRAPAWQIVDFYHACTHLKDGCDAIWGESSVRSQAEFARLRFLLKEADDGAPRVLRTLAYHRGRATGRRRKRIQAVLPYFRRQRPRMAYATYQAHHLPIGSGVVEAACKTLVTQRLKGAGMAWSMPGGQALLTLRRLIQSDRWQRAWPLLAAEFRHSVHLPDEPADEPWPLAA